MEAKNIMALFVLAALTMGGRSDGHATERLDEGMVVAALDDELSTCRPLLRARVLGVVASDARVQVRLAAARHLVSVGLPIPGPARRTIKALACDDSVEVRDALADSLADLFRLARPLEATQVLAQWSINRSPIYRRLAVEMLVRDVPFAGRLEALELLARDHDPGTAALASDLLTA